ncbi:DsrH/TusB family sulfur metabolism protein [Thalassolituus sp. C2-1]|uniref:DsrH/TusB family sulfur metabolism protein n=1 Tax=Venatorbacter sp. C2-1 TaxID=2597518 RepID=UPI0011981688|nr:DsrH/TusB family sulfur metabolism protein [Thalassolituus sp. C2-1]TVV43803.1 hypothetical protein FOT50_09105 [Thalassolituus sp. C2-1]
MTLHLLFTSQLSSLNDLRRSLSSEDAIAFIGDGVYALPNWDSSHPCYYRIADCTQRGLSEIPGAIAIDDAQWVELCLQYPRTLSWKL